MRFPKVTLLSLLFSLGAVHTTPLSRDTGKASLTVSTKVNTVGVGNIVERDRARIQALQHVSGSNSIGLGQVNVSNAMFYYTAQVGVGTPPAYRTFISRSCLVSCQADEIF